MSKVKFIAVCSPANTPIYFYSQSPDDKLQYQHLIYCALDVSLGALKNPELSFKERGYFQDAILTIEDQKIYGYVTPTLTKFFVMISKGNIDSKSVAAFFNELHAAYVRYISSPFTFPERKIESARFTEDLQKALATLNQSLASSK